MEALGDDIRPESTTGRIVGKKQQSTDSKLASEGMELGGWDEDEGRVTAMALKGKKWGIFDD